MPKMMKKKMDKMAKGAKGEKKMPAFMQKMMGKKKGK